MVKLSSRAVNLEPLTAVNRYSLNIRSENRGVEDPRVYKTLLKKPSIVLKTCPDGRGTVGAAEALQSALTGAFISISIVLLRH